MNGPGTNPGLRALFTARFQEVAGLELAHKDDLVIAAATPGSYLDLGGHGMIVGSLFERASTRAVERLGRKAARRICSSRGGELIERYWGPYVAILSDTGYRRIDILRAPLGELPCIYLDLDGATVVASDVGLLVAFGFYRPAIAWAAIARHLVIRDLSSSATCLDGISELPGGQRLTLERGACRTGGLWSPWTYAGPDRQIEDLAEAARHLRAVARECVAARASQHPSVVLMLSGGLDSSIVAACLAGQGLPFDSLTLVTRDPIGDERRHARRVSRFLGSSLTEARREVARIDVAISAAERLPRPSVRSFLQESRRLAANAARKAGGTAIFNGGGGDNVFCSLQSAAPATDRLLATGPGRAFVRTALEIGELARASLWAVVSDAVRRAWLGKPPFRQAYDTSMLTPEALAALGSTPIHPWLELAPSALPGKAMHVRLIANAQSFVESLDPQDEFPSVSPLLAQPLVELCLRVPSWLWLERGRNRAVARRAFATDLPKETIERRSKGTPDSFVAEIFEGHRSALRALLCDGELAGRGLLDVDGVLGVLDDPRPVSSDVFRRVLEFADVEAWIRAWSGSGR